MKVFFKNSNREIDNMQSAICKGRTGSLHRLFLTIAYCLSLVFFMSCNNNQSPEITYTCPMAQDSIFSNKPGQCPKCGMDLVKMEVHEQHDGDEMNADKIEKEGAYTCPMHPQIQSDTIGACPICGMQLEKVKPVNDPKAVSLDVLLQPVNQQVVANVPMVHIMERDENIEMEAFGFIAYDTRQVGVISTNISGRIEKLYVKYRFQKISKGQKIMDIYSPELLTAQENLLFLLKHDAGNEILINASRQKLLLLGVSSAQLGSVIRMGKPAFSISIYSNYSGHVHESGSANGMDKGNAAGMSTGALTTSELDMKEGMYVKKGQNIFSVFNPDKAWALINIFGSQATMIKVGDKVRITSEASGGKDFRAFINYIEPIFREGSKTLAARVYFDNSKLRIPIGSQVKATVFAGYKSANWLPEEAVLSLGMDKVVFVRTGESFVARKIETGIVHKHLIQVRSGLEKNEAVAANAQYLVDSESFIKAN